jgi:diketogulonate reductase-like aldo/keto reductase
MGIGSSPAVELSADDLRPALALALNEGVTLVDTAEVYGTESIIGDLVSGRPNVVVGSKVWRTNHAPEHLQEACRRSRERLRIERLGYYLIHAPEAWRYQGPLEIGSTWDRALIEKAAVPRDARGEVALASIPLRETWESLIAVQRRGWVERVGICNVSVEHLRQLAHDGWEHPQIVQVELNPLLPQRQLRRYCQEHKIQLMAHSPLGGGRVLRDPTMVAKSSELGRSPAELTLAWHIAHGIVPVFGSRERAHIRANLSVRHWTLPEHTRVAIDQIGLPETLDH